VQNVIKAETRDTRFSTDKSLSQQPHQRETHYIGVAHHSKDSISFEINGLMFLPKKLSSHYVAGKESACCMERQCDVSKQLKGFWLQ